MILAIARRLAQELRRRDPLAERVELSRLRFLLCGLIGIGQAIGPRPRRSATQARGAMNLASGEQRMAIVRPAGPELGAAQAHVQAVVIGSGTSFYWGMRLLPAAKRKAMYAIYAFCREVDDVADGDAPVAAKLDELAGWRREIDALFEGRPSRPTTLALLDPVARFDLPAGEFHAMIDGMEMDADDSMRAPPMSELIRYCRCVAGAVGTPLGSRVRRARRGCAARRAGAGRGVAAHQHPARSVRGCDARPALFAARAAPAASDRRGPTRSARWPIPACPRCATRWPRGRGRALPMPSATSRHGDRRALRPALVMMHVYRRTLDRLIGRGWRQLEHPVRLPRPERLWLALRYGLL